MLLTVPVGGIAAQELGGWIELSADRSDLQTVGVVGPSRTTEQLSFRQDYKLDLGWTFYPNFRMLLGGQFNRIDTSDVGVGLTPDVTQQRLRPYFNLRLGGRIYSAQFDLIRLENKTESNGFSSSDIQDSYTALFNWRPHDYPSLRLRLQRTDNHDSTRQLVNAVRDIAELVAEYQLYEKLRFFYRGAIEDFEDRISGNGLRRNAHNAEVTYGDAFWDGRARLSVDYLVNYQRSKFTSGGTGEIATPLDPIAGLSAITDMPADVMLADNPALIDNNLIASAGIDLGTPPPGGDDRPRNMGLDFGGPTTVNTLRVWVDRELPVLISNSFVWEIYTSSDNLDWQFQEIVASAPFGPLEPRFELRFVDLTARYVKAVARPLDRTVPGADQFPNIFVTELDAFQNVPSSEAVDEVSQTAQRLTTDFRLRILNNQPLFYNFSYAGRRFEDGPTAFTMSNGLTFSKQLNRVYSVAARVAREDTQDVNLDQLSYPYSASVRASALPTVQHTLVVSGRFTEINDESGRDSSVFLYNTAQLYRGVQANLTLGTAVRKLQSGERSANNQVNFGSSLLPHRTVTVNLQYQLRKEDTRGGTLPARRRDFSVGRISVAYIPVPAIYLFASYRLEQETDAEDRTIRNYSLSWSPFPGGSLQLTFRFDDTFRSQLNQQFRIFSTRARWNITSRWYVEAAYEITTNESDLTASDTETVRAITRFLF